MKILDQEIMYRSAMVIDELRKKFKNFRVTKDLAVYDEDDYRKFNLSLGTRRFGHYINGEFSFTDAISFSMLTDKQREEILAIAKKFGFDIPS